MIIWLASFPKSGNTWLRSLLSDYKNFKDKYDFESTIYSIPQFPQDFHFDFLYDEKIIRDKKKMKDLNFASQYWLVAQRRLNMFSSTDALMKTHGVPCRIGNNYFLTQETTRCAVCIIRDPRQVLFSLMKHYKFNTQKQSMEYMLLNNKSLYIPHTNKLNDEDDEYFSEIPLPSWDVYYYSWIAYKKFFPILFIKYEDMFDIITFEKVIKFIEKNGNDESFAFDADKIKKVFERSSFDKLKKREIEKGFKESKNKSAGFFNEGKTNTWVNKIEYKIRETLEKKFEKLMIEFEYL